MSTKTNELLGHLGDSVPRLEDPPLITGKGRYADDIFRPTTYADFEKPACPWDNQINR